MSYKCFLLCYCSSPVQTPLLLLLSARRCYLCGSVLCWHGAEEGGPKSQGRAPQVFPLATAFVGYVVLWNLSLQLNPVGFYQLAKTAITPAVIAIEAAFYGNRPTCAELGAVTVLLSGVLLATVTDDQACHTALKFHAVKVPVGHGEPGVI